MLGEIQLEISSAEKDQGIQQVGCEPAVCPCSKEGCNICPTRSDQQFTYAAILSPTVAQLFIILIIISIILMKIVLLSPYCFSIMYSYPKFIYVLLLHSTLSDVDFFPLQ